ATCPRRYRCCGGHSDRGRIRTPPPQGRSPHPRYGALMRALTASLVGLVLLLAGCAEPSPAVQTGQSTVDIPEPSPVSVALVVGNEIRLPDGHRITVPIPAGERVATATRASGGYLVSTGPYGTLYWVPDGKPARRIGASDGYASVWPDGSQVAFIGATTVFLGSNFVTVVRLPSGQQRRQIDLTRVIKVDWGMAAITIIGVADDRVLIRVSTSYATINPAQLLIWDVGNGQVTPVAGTGTWAWSTARDGRVLRRVDQAHPTTREATSACID